MKLVYCSISVCVHVQESLDSDSIPALKADIEAAAQVRALCLLVLGLLICVDALLCMYVRNRWLCDQRLAW